MRSDLIFFYANLYFVMSKLKEEEKEETKCKVKLESICTGKIEQSRCTIGQF